MEICEIEKFRRLLGSSHQKDHIATQCKWLDWLKRIRLENETREDHRTIYEWCDYAESIASRSRIYGFYMVRVLEPLIGEGSISPYGISSICGQ